MRRNIASVFLVSVLLTGCVITPKSTTVLTGYIWKTPTTKSNRPKFSRQEFAEVMVRLKPLFEQTGFQCYGDGSRGGFSIVEGPINHAGYGFRRQQDGSWLGCEIKGTRNGLRLRFSDYEDVVGHEGSGKFTRTQAEQEAVDTVIGRIRSFLRAEYPALVFEVEKQKPN
jgi:hypothetical protein